MRFELSHNFTGQLLICLSIRKYLWKSNLIWYKILFVDRDNNDTTEDTDVGATENKQDEKEVLTASSNTSSSEQGITKFTKYDSFNYDS